jgi:hypothetical protein
MISPPRSEHNSGPHVITRDIWNATGYSQIFLNGNEVSCIVLDGVNSAELSGKMMWTYKVHGQPDAVSSQLKVEREGIQCK